jgi:hypothetical protein
MVPPKGKKGVRILEEYFYHEEEEVTEVIHKPVIIHEISEIQHSNGNHLNSKSQKDYHSLNETVILQEFEAMIGPFAFNCSVTSFLTRRS